MLLKAKMLYLPRNRMAIRSSVETSATDLAASRK